MIARYVSVARVFCVVIAAVVIFAGAVVCAKPVAPPYSLNTVISEVMAVRVMTFNIRVDTALDVASRWSSRRRRVCDIISDYRPDVLGMQEGLKRQVDDVLESVDGYEMIGVGRKDGRTKGEYSCILYRADRFEVLDSGTFWFSDTPGVPGSSTWGNMWTRSCTWGRFLNRSTGKSFYMYNVHLDCLSQRSREKSVKLLVSRIRGRGNDDPFVVTGDFNAGEQNDAIRFLKGRGAIDQETSPIRMVDTFRTLYPFEDKVKTRGGTRKACKGKKIDYIFSEPSTRVLEADILRIGSGGRKASDHCPVTATLLID